MMSDLSDWKVMVTGGSGYLGRNLISYLKERGATVHAIYRSEASEKVVKERGAVPFKADLTDMPGMQAAMEGCQYVVHCAGFVKPHGDFAEARTINVEGTRKVMQAALSAKVKRVIHIGTEAGCVDKDGNPLININEARPLPTEPFPGVYSTTKNEAERAALCYNGEGLEVVVVRPRLIWGKDDTVVLKELSKAAKEGILKWFSGGMYLTSTCHVTNVCEGIEKALAKGRPGEAYFVTDGKPVHFKEFISRMLLSAGVDPPTSSAPFKLTWYAAQLLEKISKEPLVTRQSLVLVGQQMTVDDSKARRELGYQSNITVQEGMDELRQIHGVRDRPVWKPDYEAPTCEACTIPFTATNRRHHCRACGEVFCGNCSRAKMDLPYYSYNEPQRVCNACKEI
eukprot:TRINITY_DN4421_c0_g1_i1.p1 TRINITY_DN4421_c0_g1~~TRINITY_DN4421_c0_g1_i1.p1  ORF type:complete len:397 (+),score=83.36 TRINITY_DN4421_c0_g1_i1:48-1238(+)